MPMLCSTSTRNKPSRSCSRTARRELSALVNRAAYVAQLIEKQGGHLIPGRPAERALPGGGAEALPQPGIIGEAPQGRCKAGHVAWLDEQAFTLVVGQVGQIAGTPANHWQPEGHRLAVHRPVRLLQAGQHERVRGRVQCGNLADAHRPMYHNSSSKVRLRKASVDAFRVGRLGSRVADEVECCRVLLDGCERLE